MKKIILAAVFLLSFFMVSCTSGGESQQPDSGTQSFSQAYDAFETKLVQQLNDQDEIPEPPQGVFELTYYDSRVGKLAAYVSSNPEDGQQHPMIIWVAGGWDYGIDEFFWNYAEWDDDQTGAGFREAGVLMMYPSFRGANGNPGYYEALFGETADIAAAYEYAASLPYVDPERIYLGGHSTGGTKALLAAEYTDNFRAVFSFGPVDEVKHHNTSQFTFDTSDEEEFKMRSPIHWLQDIKTPTFIIEGQGGNSVNVVNIEKKSENENIHCYIVEGADHFSTLAPITRLLSQKILQDTDEACNITLSMQELQDAMAQPPGVSFPLMQPYYNETLGLRMAMPVIWEAYDASEEGTAGFVFESKYMDDNFWDMSMLFVDVYDMADGVSFEDMTQEIRDYGYLGDMTDVNGQPAYIGIGIVNSGYDYNFFNRVAAFSHNGRYIEFWFYTPEEYQEHADVLFKQIIDSIVFE